MLMNIYIDTDIFDGYLTDTDINIYKNLPEFLRTFGTKRAIFLAPFPRYRDFDHLTQIFDMIYDQCELIGLIVCELHDVTVDFIQKFDRPNIVMFLNGDLNFKLNHAKVYHWFSWFETTVNFYQQNKFLLDKLIPYQPKPQYFDILLGREREHRDQIFNYINNQQLADSVVMTYLESKRASGIQERSSVEWLWESEGLVIPQDPLYHTVLPVQYYNQSIRLSQIIPINVYNQTAYSLVAETWGTDNRFTFNTEKIVKPILAERLFLVASNQYYLRNLRSLGFRTFDGIVDESYDLEPDHQLRCQMVCQQLKHLISLPQEQILEQIKPITEYNKKIMLDTSWHDKFTYKFKEQLLR